MRTPSLVVLGLMLVIAAVPSGQSGTAGPATPVGMDCAVVDTDSCSNGTFASTLAAQFGASGVFQGTVTVTVSSGAAFRSISCSGLLVGAIMASGTCFISGPGIPLGAPMTLSCSSVGTGALDCYVHGA